MGWLRPEATHYLSVPPSVAQELPRPIQELLGYPLRYKPVSDPYKYNPEAGALAYRAAGARVHDPEQIQPAPRVNHPRLAGAYAYNGAPDAWPSRLVPYAEKEETHHSF